MNANIAIVNPTLLHHYFDRSARKWPDKTALEIPPSRAHAERVSLTYSQLNQRAESVAHTLIACVTRECIVAVLLPRTSPLLYVCQLAVLKAGAAYVCIDPAFPDAQVLEILADARPVAVLTDPDGIARLRLGGYGDTLWDVAMLPACNERIATPAWLSGNDLAYLIYTSGTTGRPKGVMIEHRSIANLIAAGICRYRFSPGDRVGQSSSCAYDSSVEEVWFSIASGATLVVIDDDAVRLGPDLVPWLRRERITAIFPSPTLLRSMSCVDPASELPELGLIYCGGEALPRDVADRWAPIGCLENTYGPTECAVTATRCTVGVGDAITIGHLIPGLSAWVLNDKLEEVPDGEQGELCLGGIGLARGYRNRPELTAEKFPVHARFGRIYRTGDLVHRTASGAFAYHGRIDAQVKLRGYRIELEAIESRLVECDGVREAACCLQGDGTHPHLVGFVVGDDAALRLPPPDDLASHLRRLLPEYMVPSRITYISRLPRTVSGKVDRKSLPKADLAKVEHDRPVVLPSGESECAIECAVRDVLQLKSTASVDLDFFNDLGGTSLHAACLVSRLRAAAETSALNVRDVYEARTIAELARRLTEVSEDDCADAPSITQSMRQSMPQKTGRHLLATTVQALWLLTELVFASAAAWVSVAYAIPWAVKEFGVIPLLIAAPLLLVLGTSAYAALAVAFTVLLKRVLIGRYVPVREPVWGNFYVRNWIVQQAALLIPWKALEGTAFHVAALRALGARIGERVHIHREVNLRQGGWDLLEIGDDATICQQASLGVVELEDGHIIVAPVSVGARATVDVRATVSGNAVLEPETYLTGLSMLSAGAMIPQGERWDGIPARRAGLAPRAPEVTVSGRHMSVRAHSVAMLVARLVLGIVLGLPYELPVLAWALAAGLDTQHATDWLNAPSFDSHSMLVLALLAAVPIPFGLIFEALVLRAMGTVRPGVIHRYSLAYIRVWLKSYVVLEAGEWLAGSLFWPRWLRLAGMRLGPDCEVGTLLDVVPELNTIGSGSFFADVVYLGVPRVHRGTVTLGRCHLGEGTFLGNDVIIPAGQNLPQDVLLGVATVADDSIMQAGTSWFGHPAFRLPQREVVACDETLTHRPSLVAYTHRVFWESLRFLLPCLGVLPFTLWYDAAMRAENIYSLPVFLFVALPLLNLVMTVSFGAIVILAKWAMLGRVKPGVHPFWSGWCYRWDFLFIVWAVYARPMMMALEGTLLLSCYLRAMGMKIGRRVVLGPGVAHVVDPDMLQLDDDATFCGHFQAHTFEDRVLKIDRIRVGRGASVGQGAILLYGAAIGAGARVAANSVVMKQEHLTPGVHYHGAPTQPIQLRSVGAPREQAQGVASQPIRSRPDDGSGLRAQGSRTRSIGRRPVDAPLVRVG